MSALLFDWLGTGGVPVAQVTADIRAHVCYKGDGGKPCPMNVAPNWWEKVKSAIADVIKKQLEIKNSLDLKAHGEDKLFMCRACGCCLKLAVWVPVDRLKEHTTREQLDKMPSFCWKKKEIFSYGRTQ